MALSGSSSQKIFVALSGGVDSSVAARLLLDQGAQVEGVTMSMGGFLPPGEKAGSIEAAREAAEALSIPLHVIDVDRPQKEQVVDVFIEEYLSGRTPNPCVRCNRFVKFGVLFDEVRRRGADALATGHYIRLVEAGGGVAIYKARDRRKDQSYFLCLLKQDVLENLCFPLGEFTKRDVWEMAQSAGLPCASREESQDICFVRGDGGYQEFLEQHLGERAFQPGVFRDHTGKVVGDHKGIARYTVGQRDGLGIALGYPAYIFRMDPQTNTIYVGPREYLQTFGLRASHFNDLGLRSLPEDMEIRACIRYNAAETPVRVKPAEGGEIEAWFSEPQFGAAPGQNIAFYAQDRLVGGAVIERPLKSEFNIKARQ
ncbi:MAG: tRNA 2-thiouridine(34) synthase MnmA [Candidatus Omnitrophota bacterium]